MKPFQLAYIALLLPHVAFASEAETWQLAKTTIARIDDGALPSVACDPARQEYFLLLADDAESIIILQHPDGRCVAGFPTEDQSEASAKTKRMVMSQPLQPMDGNTPIIWIGATLDRSGTTAEFFKLIMKRSKGGVKDTMFLRRKGAGTPVQWILS